MDIRDFEGLTKYKFYLPTVYVCSWICMILGPLLFEATYIKICIIVLIYMNLKVIVLFFIMIYIVVKSRATFKRAEGTHSIVQQGQRQQLDPSQQVYYAFILPNYKEEVEMMAETLDLLASHKRAKSRYLIFMAMEAQEEGSQLKAQELLRRFKQKFRVMGYTRHEIRQHQQKGKASNVSWCAQHLQPQFQKNMIDPDQVFVTVLDADSWAPDMYFDVLEQELVKNYHRRHILMFQPPQIFTRNNLNVPFVTRVQDIMHSYLQCTNLFSVFDITFPISNYTLSYKLIKRVGFWDTCADAIGEDFHMAQKVFWKTQGEFKTIPIYVPFNQVNISTGNGYVEDVVARFWQAERHAQGCADLAWNFKMLFSTKFKPINIIVFFQIFQTFTMPAVLPWVLISLLLQSKIMYFGSHQPEQIITPLMFPILFNLMSVVSTIGYFFYEYFKRKSNRLIYHQKNQHILHMLEYPIFFTINLFLILVPTFVIAAFMSLTGKTEYTVALKKNTSKAQNQNIQNQSSKN